MTPKTFVARFFIWLKQRKAWDWALMLALAFVLLTQAPGWLNSWRMKGQAAPQASLMDLEGALSTFPPESANSLILFWATWCGPCEVELNRLKEAAEKGEIDPAKVLAISSGEEAETVKKAAAERGYPFRVLLDPTTALAMSFKVRATPTVIFVDSEKKVKWMSTGISPSLVARAKDFIPQQQQSQQQQ